MGDCARNAPAAISAFGIWPGSQPDGKRLTTDDGVRESQRERREVHVTDLRIEWMPDPAAAAGGVGPGVAGGSPTGYATQSRRL